MRTLLLCGLASAFVTGTAWATPNIVSNSQKGSLLIFTHIVVSQPEEEGANETTIVRLVNDGDNDVKVKCIYVDGGASQWDDPTDPPITFKNWSDFVLTLTPRQPVWFDASTGYGSSGPGTANRFPTQFDRGELICFAITSTEQNKRKYNHLAGTATYMDFWGGTAAEYTAHAFYARTLSGDPTTLALDGVEYDYCPTYLVGQFMPAGAVVTLPDGKQIGKPHTQLAVSGCTQYPVQDGSPVFTKLEFEVWNAHEVKFTGAYRCSDSWWETSLADDGLMYNAANFTFEQLGTASAYYRVKGVASIRCPGSVEVGLIGTQRTSMATGTFNPACGDCEVLDYFDIETHVTHAGQKAGSIAWDRGSVTEEGQIR